MKAIKSLQIVLILCLLLGCYRYNYSNPYDGSSSGSQKETAMDNFQSLAYMLVNDALDLLPQQIADEVAPKGDISSIMEGIKPSKASSMLPKQYEKSSDLGIIAAHMVREIYGSSPSKDMVIPQIVYYYGQEDEDLNKSLEDVKKKLSASLNKNSDSYNTSLTMLVNSWLLAFKNSGKDISDLPKSGTYLRDSGNNLYLYEEGDK